MVMLGVGSIGPHGGPGDRFASSRERDRQSRANSEKYLDDCLFARERAERRKRPYDEFGDCHLCGTELHGTRVKWWNKDKGQLVHTDCARKLA